MSERQFHLNAFLMGVGHHEAAWRHPNTDAANLLDVKHFQNLGRIAERGKLDSVFFADGLAVGPRVKHNTQAIFEPVTLAVGDSGSDRQGWPDRHGFDQLRRSVHSRAEVRFARSHQRWPRRVEHRDVGRRR